MSKLMTIYHGSSQVIETPVFGAGRKNNDFGLGFYCTQSNSLAKEWAVSSLKSGFSNKYTLDAEFLNTLVLNSPDYSILNWMAVLVEHRLFSIKTPVARRARAYLIENFGVNVNAYDLVVGYRADDSYFDFAEAFLNNAITVEQLSRAMSLGKLGEQIVLKSKFAFSRIKFEGFETAEKDTYYVFRKARDDGANAAYQQILEETAGADVGTASNNTGATAGTPAATTARKTAGADATAKSSASTAVASTESGAFFDDGLFIQDIIRGGITNDDPRIPRNATN